MDRCHHHCSTIILHDLDEELNGAGLGAGNYPLLLDVHSLLFFLIRFFGAGRMFLIFWRSKVIIVKQADFAACFFEKIVDMYTRLEHMLIFRAWVSSG